jgi:hypothetical protein
MAAETLRTRSRRAGVGQARRWQNENQTVGCSHDGDAALPPAAGGGAAECAKTRPASLEHSEHSNCKNRPIRSGKLVWTRLSAARYGEWRALRREPIDGRAPQPAAWNQCQSDEPEERPIGDRQSYGPRTASSGPPDRSLAGGCGTPGIQTPWACAGSRRSGPQFQYRCRVCSALVCGAVVCGAVVCGALKRRATGPNGAQTGDDRPCVKNAGSAVRLTRGARHRDAGRANGDDSS